MEHNFTWKNDGRTKVMIGCGTRPEIIRLAAVIKRCREYFDCCVVYYNQNWDRNLSTVFWEDFELRNTFGEYGPDILVPVVGENLGVTCGNILGRSYELLSELQPEGYLVLGDTNSCLSVIGAKRLHIPIFHMEAGNRCFDQRVPEEINRRIGRIKPEVEQQMNQELAAADLLGERLRLYYPCAENDHRKISSPELTRRVKRPPPVLNAAATRVVIGT